MELKVEEVKPRLDKAGNIRKNDFIEFSIECKLLDLTERKTTAETPKKGPKVISESFPRCEISLSLSLSSRGSRGLRGGGTTPGPGQACSAVSPPGNRRRTPPWTEWRPPSGSSTLMATVTLTGKSSSRWKVVQCRQFHYRKIIIHYCYLLLVYYGYG